ncbi:MAG: HAMP domain-containing sensor histidine kinase [Candidatus Sericytochromatia bacterium]|nr:HAMP domain-containing sensor histidine kinase [Candidatus Sericytochromatia bacterium]
MTFTRRRNTYAKGAGRTRAPLALDDSAIRIIDHEFRTPLNIIMGFSVLLVDGGYGPLSPEAREASAQILASATRLKEILEDLQLHANLMNGRGTLQVDEISAEELASALRGEFEAEFTRRNQRLEIQLAQPIPRLHSDVCRLYTAMRHLLANAHKFTPPGGRIILRIEPLKSGWRLSVLDNGIGIPEDAKARVFENFFQADASDARSHGGLGLGLAIVKALVRSLGGDVALESEPGNGSRFAITLPADPRHIRR